MLTLFSILYSLFCVREYVVEDSKIYEMFCYKYKLLLNHIFFFKFKSYPSALP